MVDNKLERQFTSASLLGFAFPSIIMMLTMSMYVIVDGMFVSRILGTTALSAINMIYPFILLQVAVAIMLATGGSAYIAKQLGEGKLEQARSNFSFLIFVLVAIALAFTVIGLMASDVIINILGATELQYQMCKDYLVYLLLFAPFFFLQSAFQTFFVTAGKPSLGLVLTIGAGVINLILDYVFMVPLGMGIKGAAIATGVGAALVAVAGLGFFFFNKSNPLRFVIFKVNIPMLLKSSSNGSSEMVTNLANALTTYLYNLMFLKFYGEDGVAAITIVMYLQYIFSACYFGYANGIAPVVSFKYGKQDLLQLKSIFKISIVSLLIAAAMSQVAVNFGLNDAVLFFTKEQNHVYDLILNGMQFFTYAFIFMGFTIFSSAFFTAFSDGKSSALISFMRTFIFEVACILLLPMAFSEIGLWMAIPVAECLATLVAITLICRKRKVYCYF